MSESSKTGGDTAQTELPSTAQGGTPAPKRTRKPRAAASSNAFDDFVKAVRPELSWSLGGDAEADNVIDDPAYRVVFRTWYDLSKTLRSISNAASKCRDSLVNILAGAYVRQRMQRDTVADAVRSSRVDVDATAYYNK